MKPRIKNTGTDLIRLKFFAVCLVFGAVLAVGGAAAQAGPLDDARAAGFVGETPQGLLAAVSVPPSAEIRALIDDINIRRMAQYRESADEAGVTVEQFQAIIGERLIDEARPGTFIMDADGNWVRVP